MLSPSDVGALNRKYFTVLRNSTLLSCWPRLCAYLCIAGKARISCLHPDSYMGFESNRILVSSPPLSESPTSAGVTRGTLSCCRGYPSPAHLLPRQPRGCVWPSGSPGAGILGCLSGGMILRHPHDLLGPPWALTWWRSHMDTCPPHSFPGECEGCSHTSGCLGDRTAEIKF